MRVVLLCLFVVIVGVVSAKKNGNGDGKGTLQMMGEDYCGVGKKCSGDPTHVVCMNIGQDFWDTTEQAVTGEGDPHKHCICVGALTYYLNKKGVESVDCGLIDCDGSNFDGDSYLSPTGGDTDQDWGNGNSLKQQTAPARNAVNQCCSSTTGF